MQFLQRHPVQGFKAFEASEILQPKSLQLHAPKGFETFLCFGSTGIRVQAQTDQIQRQTAEGIEEVLFHT